MSPSGLHVNKPVIFVLLFGLTAAVVWWMWSPSPEAKLDLPKTSAVNMGGMKDLPENAKDNLDKVEIKKVADKKIKVKDQEITLAYKEVTPANSKLDVLLLHGQKFSSDVWSDERTNTLQVLYNLGYHAVALDLPGFGGSSALKGSGTDAVNAECVERVVAELKLDAPVIISPSMSGQYSLAYLFKDLDTVEYKSKGFVPIAPVGTDQHNVEEYKKLKIPTLIVYGSEDTHLGVTSLENLQNIPNSVVAKIEDGSHPCYLDNPDLFHKYLYNFLSSLK